MITATDSNNATLSGSKAYALTVERRCQFDEPDDDGTATVRLQCGTERYRWFRIYTFAVTAGALPSWLTLNSEREC